MTSSSEHGPPNDDEIEVSIFGPGVGECIVLHLGANEWVVVDSCLDGDGPVALKYLDDLGVSPDRIKHLVITHWHEDHYRGASAVYAAAPDAVIHCSAALREEEFKNLLKVGRAKLAELGTREMDALLTERKRRAPSTVRNQSVNLSWLASQQVVFRSEDRATELVALSPSQGTLALAKQELKNLLPAEGETKRRLVALSANSVAVVLSLTGNGRSILLGSDLEVTMSSNTGWNAVVQDAQNLRLRPSAVYKVAHHGSETAYSEKAWTALVEEAAHCVVTPYSPSQLPRPEDLSRMQRHTASLYRTAPSRGKRVKARGGPADAASLIAKDRRLASPGMGHVRLRIARNGSITSKLFGTATPVT